MYRYSSIRLGTYSEGLIDDRVGTTDGNSGKLIRKIRQREFGAGTNNGVKIRAFKGSLGQSKNR